MQNLTFEQSFEIVKTLVKDFQDGLSYYTAKEYLEAQVRKDFIDKFFIALGWDVNHEHQKNPYEQEVKVERTMQIGDNPKYADYSFCLAPDFRQPRFLVEAKKPSHDLYNKDYYFQSIRYAWNNQTPIVILTDFEEFHVIDSRYKPDIETALQRKINVYRFTEFADEEKFRYIYHLFSRESVAENSIEKFAESLKKPAGKAVQKTLFAMGGVQPVDETFLEDLDEYRKTLASSFKKTNPTLNSYELTEAVQRTLDRLIFIRFLEDKLIENEHYVSEFGDKASAWQEFINVSRKLDAKYNGIVFKPHLIDGKNNFNPPEDKNFGDICDDLSHINSPYLFNQIPIHILGSIYERFLGKIVVPKGRGITVEEKPEVRKAGGVYYTPQYIVEYIVNNTVGKLIEGKTPKEISKLRFADIACGSGSFLITVFDTILKYHGWYYNENPEQAKKDGCILVYNLKDESFFDSETRPDKIYVLSLQQKGTILKNNIYGVDIDSQAVEVTQVSLFLKLLEDETPASANETWNMFGKKEALLPSLENNIICGNSLIGSDIYDGQLFSGEEERKINPMDFEVAFPEVMKNGGFDCIVGNPPYVGIHGIDDIQTTYYKTKYVVGKKQFNLFSLFIERGLALISNNNFLSFIIPSLFLKGVQFDPVRNFINNNSKEFYFEEKGDKVFKNVQMPTMIFILTKGKNDSKNFFKKKYSPNLDFEGTKFIPLNVLFDVKRGLEIGKDKLINTGKFKILTGKDISQYLTKSISHIDESTYSSFSKNKIYFEQKRIAIRETGDRIVATIVKANILTTRSIYNLIPRSKKVNIFSVLGILNSTYYYYYYKRFISPETNIFPKIRIIQVKEIPILKNLDESQSSNSSLEKISILVQDLLKYKDQIKEVNSDNDLNRINSRIKSITYQIDQFVYKLYDLTPEEIKIIEGE